MQGLFWLLLYQWFGTALSTWGLPLPGPIIGMLLLLLHLQLRGSVESSLQKTSAALLRHLPLLLIPPAVGVMTQMDVLLAHRLAIVASLGVSLVVALPLTGWVMQRLMRRRPA